MTKKVEPFTAGPSEPIQLLNMGSVPGKSFEFLKSANQTNATPSCIEPLLERMNAFLKDYTAPSQDPASQLLLQSVKADLQRLRDELKSARANKGYVIQLRKKDLFVIESNFNRLAGVFEGFQSSMCTKDGDPTSVLTYLNDARDTIIYIYQNSYSMTSTDYNEMTSYLADAHRCMQMIKSGTATQPPPIIDSIDTFISTTNDLEAMVLEYMPDPTSNITCVAGGDPVIVKNAVRDLKDTIIYIYSQLNGSIDASELSILNTTIVDANTCMSQLQPGVSLEISQVNSLTDVINSTNNLSAAYDTYAPMTALQARLAAEDPAAAAEVAAAAAAAGYVVDYGERYGDEEGGTGSASATGSAGATGPANIASVLGLTGGLGLTGLTGTLDITGITNTLGLTGLTGGNFNPSSTINTLTSNVLNSLGSGSSINFAVFTGGTGTTGGTGGNLALPGFFTSSATGSTGATSTTSRTGATGPTGATSSQNITLAQTKDLVLRIDREILRLS